MSKIGKIGRGLFGVAVLSALGLGATQALAMPRMEMSAKRACVFSECQDFCVGLGYDAGRCMNRTSTDSWCECYIRS